MILHAEGGQNGGRIGSLFFHWVVEHDRNVYKVDQKISDDKNTGKTSEVAESVLHEML